VGDPDGNSLPSGHTTLAVALGVALVVALPRALRPVAAVAATGAALLVGVATMVAGWHRPSDLVAAVAVVAGVGAAVRLVEELRAEPAAQRRPAGARASTTWSR
jgi:membrane-associated phospholipid phosphatase